MSQGLWCGIKCSSTRSVTGCRRPPNTWSAACSAVPDASRCSVVRHWWTTTWWKNTLPSLTRRDTTCNMIRERIVGCARCCCNEATGYALISLSLHNDFILAWCTTLLYLKNSLRYNWFIIIIIFCLYNSFIILM